MSNNPSNINYVAKAVTFVTKSQQQQKGVTVCIFTSAFTENNFSLKYRENELSNTTACKLPSEVSSLVVSTQLILQTFRLLCNTGKAGTGELK